MALRRAEAASEVMWHLVTHDAHGYSQPYRYGDGGTEDIYLSDGEKVTIRSGDCDCSSASIECYECLGISCGGATYTGNMRAGFLGSGNFEEINPYDAQDGDVLLNHNSYSQHTEMCIVIDGTRYQAGFRHSEGYGIDGDQGDQTGDEASYSDFEPWAWDTALRYIGPEKNEQEIDTREINMDDWAIVAFDGAGYLYAGGKLHPLVNTPSTDEQKFVEDIYAMAKEQRDRGEMPHILLGDGQDVVYGVGPWGKKLAEILAR